MTSIYTHQFIDAPLTFTAEKGSLLIAAGDRTMAHICGIPPHVATHTVAAFNRAMQAVPDRSGWTYTTKSGVWHIHDAGKPLGFRAQHDGITGDNDPAWMFADARSLIGCMDEIDAIEDGEACDVCGHLVGTDALTAHDNSLFCDDCGKTEAEHERELAEMADDDRAHGAMERAVGL